MFLTTPPGAHTPPGGSGRGGPATPPPHDLVEVYRHHEVFTALRDRGNLKGKCSVCNYRPRCGGSRARAYAVTGDYLEAEPYCAYVPPRWAQLVEQGRVPDEAAYFAQRQRPVTELPLL